MFELTLTALKNGCTLFRKKPFASFRSFRQQNLNLHVWRCLKEFFNRKIDASKMGFTQPWDESPYRNWILEGPNVET